MEINRRSWIVFLSGVMMIALFLTGCGTSRPAKFYTLSAVKSTAGGDRQTGLSETSVTVGVGPVEIPDYLDRAQIVTRTSKNELDMAEFARWGGSLKTDISRVVLENLSGLLHRDQVSVIPWTREGSQRYRVTIDVIRLDVTPGQDVWLKARWTIYGQGGKTVVMARESEIREPVAGRDIGASVEAMSRALGNLSQEMADGLASELGLKGKSLTSGKAE